MKLRTQRLTLRPPALADAARVSLLAGEYDVASMTATIPHPYSEKLAAEWIGEISRGEEGVVFMIEQRGTVIGCTGYRACGGDHAELGYWIGKPFWGRGCATEAVSALIAHAFDADGFEYLLAGYFSDNPASARVIEKLGFVAQGGVSCASVWHGAHPPNAPPPDSIATKPCPCFTRPDGRFSLCRG